MQLANVRGIQPISAAPLQAGSVRGSADGSEPDASGPTPPQHLQRKVLRRVRFLEKVAAARPVLGPRGGGARKRRGRRVSAKPSGLAALDMGLSSLAASLGEVERETAERAGAPRKGLGAGGAKARSRITASETQRLRQVWTCSSAGRVGCSTFPPPFVFARRVCPSDGSLLRCYVP